MQYVCLRELMGYMANNMGDSMEYDGNFTGIMMG